jgi:predicted transcriptional regulator
MSSEPAKQPGKPPETDEALTLTDAKAMRAVAHPVRMGLIELFGYHETLTATEASELLGESPANCAFHLRTLAKYGFVREAGGGKGRQRPWALVNRNVMITAHRQEPQAALAADELAKVWLDRWIERARRVFGSRPELPGWEEASGWTSRHVFLTPEETVRLRNEVRKMLYRYEDRLTNPALRPDGALPVEWAIFAAPVPAELSEPASAVRPDVESPTGDDNDRQ